MKPEDSKGAITETVSTTRRRSGPKEKYTPLEYQGLDSCANKTKRTKQNRLCAIHAASIIQNPKNWPASWSVEMRTSIMAQFNQLMQYLMARPTILAAVGRIKDPELLSDVAFSIAGHKLKGADAYAMIRQYRGGMKFRYPDIGKKLDKLVGDFISDYPGAPCEWVKRQFDQETKRVSDWLASKISKSDKTPPG